MSLIDIWKEYEPVVDFSRFARGNSPLPCLDFSKLGIKKYSDFREILSTPLDGDTGSVLTYKEKAGQVLGIEEVDKETWKINQIHGVKPKGYRIQTGLDTDGIWIDVIKGSIPLAKENGVRRLIIPDPTLITNISDAHSSTAMTRYERLARGLKMKFSEEIKTFIRDL